MPGEHFTQNKHRIEDRSISELVGIARVWWLTGSSTKGKRTS